MKAPTRRTSAAVAAAAVLVVTLSSISPTSTVDAFTSPLFQRGTSLIRTTTTTTSLNQQPQLFDANGNPVSMPMVYDANGNLVPFNPAAMQPPPPQQQQQQPPPAAQPVIPTFEPNLPNALEPPLPVNPKSASVDPRPAGFNSDAYTMSNTADVYFAQLKQDSKVRKIARLSGDRETSEQVFGDSSIQEIGNSWNQNPYTKEKNIAEAKAELEGTVRMQQGEAQFGDRQEKAEAASGPSYREKLAQMKAERAGGKAVEASPKVVETVVPPPVVAAAVAPPKVVETPPVVAVAPPKVEQPRVEIISTPPPPTIAIPEPIVEKPAAPKMEVEAPKAQSPSNSMENDPLAKSVASVEAALKMYKESNPAEREANVMPLRMALMAAASASNRAIMDVEMNAERRALGVSSVSPSVTAPVEDTTATQSVYSRAVAQQEQQPAMEQPAMEQPAMEQPAMEQPAMGFPTTYAVTKPEEDIAEEIVVPAAPVTESAVPSAASSAGVETNEVLDPEDVEDAQQQLGAAVINLDSTKISTLLTRGAKMDEELADDAFWAVVRAVDRAEEEDKPLSADVPRMLHHIFDADMSHLLSREQIRTNVTCMQPEELGANAIAMNSIFDDSAHKDLPLSEGRRCEDGDCCDECSRNVFPTFAGENEINFGTFPELASLTFNELEKVSAATILQFMRLIERVRRTIAHEYGLPLSTILPLQAYSRKYVAGTTQKGGGGGEGDFVILHTDEATHTGYHYSCVIYLSESGVDFEGGAFVFNDPLPEGAEKQNLESLPLEEQIRRTGREFKPFNPTRGAAVIFSSGWENMHEVEKITSGTRFAVPCFFTTCPVPEEAYGPPTMAVGKPKNDDDIADDWLHLLLTHRQEEVHQSLGRVKELLMKWHYLCTPLADH